MLRMFITIRAFALGMLMVGLSVALLTATTMPRWHDTPDDPAARLRLAEDEKDEKSEGGWDDDYEDNCGTA